MICTLNSQHWSGPFSVAEQEMAIQALEGGEVLFFPELAFDMQPEETSLFGGSELEGKTKNISFNSNQGTLKGLASNFNQKNTLMTLMSRYVNHSTHLIKALLPHYQHNLITGRTSFRPVEVLGRQTSPRQDDTRLHVDAFPATPNQGKRILRVFSNVNQEERDRIWNLGEPFGQVVQRFGPRLKKPVYGARTLLSTLKITKSYRTLYDHYMLKLHDSMKLDEDYQSNVEKLEFQFPPGSTWVVMTDCVSHAALAGQFMLEQTFYLAPEHMENPELSPLRILEKYFSQKLT